MMKVQRADLRHAFATWAPGILVAVWGLLAFDGGWVQRVLTALGFGFLVQIVGYMAYYAAVYLSASLAGEKPDAAVIGFEDRRVSGALLLTAFVYVLGQHWRNEARATIVRCVANETSVSAFGQFSNANELVEYCINEYGQDDSPLPD